MPRGPWLSQAVSPGLGARTIPNWCPERKKKLFMTLQKSYINNTIPFVGFFFFFFLPLSLRFLFLDCFEIDNFTDPTAKSCCSAWRSRWMPFGRLLVCLRVFLSAGDIRMNPGLEITAPESIFWSCHIGCSQGPQPPHPSAPCFFRLKVPLMKIQRWVSLQFC